jgi:hypothetical protein
MFEQPFPTQYPDVNESLLHLSDRVQSVLGPEFIGLYVYGSLAAGDFDPARSDLDTLIVTQNELLPDHLTRLEKMHLDLAASGSPWAAKTESWYVPLAALPRYDRNHSPRPRMNDGRFFSCWQGEDWIIHRYVLRKQGIVVSGPSLQSGIEPVMPDDLRHAVKCILNGWWLPLIAAPDRVARLQNDDLYQAYAVLIMCRALHTFQTGELLSKNAAGRWALPFVPERFRPLIGEAIEWKPGKSFKAYDETVAFINETPRLMGLQQS